jgi:energy-coupling factor transporter ATP-binding protein EcfA2
VAIEGRNGCGKSVLLGSVAGIGAPSQVTIEWKGARVPAPILAAQYPELQLFEERASEEVTYAAVCRGLPRRRAIELAANSLALLGLGGESFLGRRTWALSAGEKRLVGVVGSLIAPASLVVLDEPTAGLDPARKEGLAVLIRRRAEAGAVLLASQDPRWMGGLGAARVVLAG